MHSVFIDGQAGTTGLQIVQKLRTRNDIELLEIPEADRKNPEIKREYLNSADVVILCLPDEAARESVSLIQNTNVKILDASTAHRVDPNWTYGLPELTPSFREKIKISRYVSVPGCYPTGFIVALSPLIKAGIVPTDYPVTIQAVSGYSGGGRELIATYRQRESESSVSDLWSYRPYALQLSHKHLPEMQFYTGLKRKPVFVPSVAHIRQGMLVMIPLYRHLLVEGDIEKIGEVYQNYYQAELFIDVKPLNHFDGLNNGFLSPGECNDTNKLELLVFGNQEHYLLVARLDNLGKGASGAAVQNLNLMLGIDEATGLM